MSTDLWESTELGDRERSILQLKLHRIYTFRLAEGKEGLAAATFLILCPWTSFEEEEAVKLI